MCVVASVLQLPSIVAANAAEEPAGSNWQENVEAANARSLVFIKAVAIIKADEDLNEESSGTGFIVHKDGYVLTCSHVVPASGAKFKSVKITGALGSRYEHEYPLREIARDEQSDLLLLRLSQSSVRSLKSAALASLGAEILSLGFPLKQDLTSVPGTLTNMNSDTGRWLTNTALNHGMSGGPVLDKSGRIVAVIRAGHEEAQSLNELIPITIATSLLQKIDSPLLPIAAGNLSPTPTPTSAELTSAPTSRPPNPRLVIERAWQAILALGHQERRPTPNDVQRILGRSLLPDGVDGREAFVDNLIANWEKCRGLTQFPAVRGWSEPEKTHIGGTERMTYKAEFFPEQYNPHAPYFPPVATVYVDLGKDGRLEGWGFGGGRSEQQPFRRR